MLIRIQSFLEWISLVFYSFIVSETWNLRSAVYEMEKSFGKYYHIPSCNTRKPGAAWMIFRNSGHFFQTSSLEAISIAIQFRNVFMTQSAVRKASLLWNLSTWTHANFRHVSFYHRTLLPRNNVIKYTGHLFTIQNYNLGNHTVHYTMLSPSCTLPHF
jgi:hypothetical protein